MSGGQSERTRRVSAFFDSQAATYDASYDRRGGSVVQARLAAVLRLLGEPPGDVLDAGMGGGRLCVELERRGWNVSGVDASAEMVALARERLPRARERLLQAPLEELPFPPASFDAVVATGVLEYVDDLGQALRELHRTLRPGGRALVSFPNYAALPSRFRGRVLYPAVRLVKRRLHVGRPMLPFDSRHPLRRDAFEAALRQGGLQVLSVSIVGTRGLPGAAARWIEGEPSLAGRLLGLQFVFEARRV